MKSNVVPGKTLVRLKYDHPGSGCVFRVRSEVEAHGFYWLSFDYQADSKFKVNYSMIAHESELEIVN